MPNQRSCLQEKSSDDSGLWHVEILYFQFKRCNAKIFHPEVEWLVS